MESDPSSPANVRGFDSDGECVFETSAHDTSFLDPAAEPDQRRTRKSYRDAGVELEPAFAQPIGLLGFGELALSQPPAGGGSVLGAVTLPAPVSPAVSAPAVEVVDRIGPVGHLVFHELDEVLCGKLLAQLAEEGVRTGFGEVDLAAPGGG